MSKTTDKTVSKQQGAKEHAKSVIPDGKKEYTGETESGREDKGAKR